MDLGSKSYLIHVSQALPPSTTPGSSIFGTPIHHSDTSFPIIAVAGIGIVATAFLLVSYYIFVIKCCLNWHRVDILRRFSLSRNRRDEDQLMVYSPRVETRGLDEAVIRSIPLLQFKKDGNYIGLGEGSFCECAVCLNEFQEDEKLRIIPNCSHVFHIDCIDVWLQSNANCPLCRTSISTTPRFPFDRTVAPSSSPQDPSPYAGSLSGGDEDYVVIELSNDNTMDQAMLGRQGRSNSGELSLSVRSISPSPRKLEHRVLPKKFERKFHNMITSMGDECIDIRGKDDQFSIQPIRRSFSMDSSADRQLYLAVQAAMQQQRQISEVSLSEGCSSGRVRRSFFSFGNGRGSRNAILPVYLEP
ncbi:RING-H2 finger protein ATL16-like [Pyrus ussuriensis x Pyrus communis]|uniref:RING-type E3 ubiquitin transferase n=1 Tax=Pyrus ussuriensis x Pyrus communis TaxID=2448454 RepID=A0A5N5H3F4_9ROSA|nr:RING-H2 finger protein ATL16-like [Pyrus ussuriensis x Pyrus communis]